MRRRVDRPPPRPVPLVAAAALRRSGGGIGGGGVADLEVPGGRGGAPGVGGGHADGPCPIEGEESDDDEGFEAAYAEGDVAPSKWVNRRVELAVRCAVRHVNMEGLSDGRSMKAILAQLSPRTLALVRGDERSTEAMRSHSAGPAASGPPVHAPRNGESIDGSSHKSAYVKLSDAVLRSAEGRVRKVGRTRLQGSTVCSTRRMRAEPPPPRGRPPPRQPRRRRPPGRRRPRRRRRPRGGGLLEPAPRGAARRLHLRHRAAARWAERALSQAPRPSLVARSTMSRRASGLALKQQLAKSESTEFVDGALVINGRIRVKKNGAGKLLLEGATARPARARAPVRAGAGDLSRCDGRTGGHSVCVCVLCAGAERGEERERAAKQYQSLSPVPCGKANGSATVYARLILAPDRQAAGMISNLRLHVVTWREWYSIRHTTMGRSTETTN